jgi:hypothetical protein
MKLSAAIHPFGRPARISEDAARGGFAGVAGAASVMRAKNRLRRAATVPEGDTAAIVRFIEPAARHRRSDASVAVDGEEHADAGEAEADDEAEENAPEVLPAFVDPGAARVSRQVSHGCRLTDVDGRQRCRQRTGDVMGGACSSV